MTEITAAVFLTAKQAKDLWTLVEAQYDFEPFKRKLDEEGSPGWTAAETAAYHQACLDEDSTAIHDWSVKAAKHPDEDHPFAAAFRLRHVLEERSQALIDIDDLLAHALTGDEESDYIDYLEENGCDTLSDEAIEDLAALYRLKREFCHLLAKAAMDPCQTHIFAVAYRLQSALQSIVE